MVDSPKPNGTANSSCGQCFVCKQDIREATSEENGEKALWCEGCHKQWAHAHCVDIGDDLYQALQDSCMPWACISCTKEAFKAYHCLPSLQQTVESLHVTLATLKEEIALLKESVAHNTTSSSHPRQAGNSSASLVSGCMPTDNHVGSA